MSTYSRLVRSAVVTVLTFVLSHSSLHATTIATYPPGTLLENVAISPVGNLYVTSILTGTVYQVTPAGVTTEFAQVPTALAGITIGGDGTLVTVGESSVFRYNLDGTQISNTTIPGSAFLNGVTPFTSNSFLIADDTAATVWRFDVNTGTAIPWLSGGLLTPPSDFPIGPNGVKLFGNAAYISVTGNGIIVRVPILADGSAGVPQIYASITADDFAFGSDGSIFAATQTGNSVVRIYPDGSQITIATAADGLLGDAAVAFGRTAADSHDLYVVNNGGAFSGSPDLGPGSIVRLVTDTTGVTLESQAVPEPETIWLSAAGFALLLLRRSSSTR